MDWRNRLAINANGANDANGALAKEFWKSDSGWNPERES